jgi:hypothetical protein
MNEEKKNSPYCCVLFCVFIPGYIEFGECVLVEAFQVKTSEDPKFA